MHILCYFIYWYFKNLFCVNFQEELQNYKNLMMSELKQTQKEKEVLQKVNFFDIFNFMDYTFRKVTFSELKKKIF